jgi:GNAT superfamily N-acetyltransferase
VDVGTIRSAAPDDATRLARLFIAVGAAGCPQRSELAASLARGHVIVLDVGSELGGAACVVVECADDREVRASVQYLFVHPSLAGTGAEERLITAVLAVCEASGCVDLDAAAAWS